MKNGVRASGMMELPAPHPRRSGRWRAALLVVVAALGIGGIGFSLQHGCRRQTCPDGQMYSGDAHRCITPE